MTNSVVEQSIEIVTVVDSESIETRTGVLHAALAKWADLGWECTAITPGRLSGSDGGRQYLLLFTRTLPVLIEESEAPATRGQLQRVLDLLSAVREAPVVDRAPQGDTMVVEPDENGPGVRFTLPFGAIGCTVYAPGGVYDYRRDDTGWVMTKRKERGRTRAEIVRGRGMSKRQRLKAANAAYHAGTAAFARGQRMKDCPHKTPGDDRGNWIKGWRAASQRSRRPLKKRAR